ncbi:MAG: thiol-disulfide oxidoreductase ResA [Bacillota bacterium]|jgi:peroxiredoxin|uniref:thiol-disulfide oxidoreductase ResA n=1 Tax=Fictibacillus TaxID=1329200 RepID=UPI0018CD8F13|nr:MULTISPECIES: thiol-disulfide oxidoreductase ResA [unclassified Fictibacillus]MBH0157148.1 thiol-disulfide oxidoreductase ResA [Fictibacillus sp. 5RED26]MBH0159469.1 thiol-disulfide oxidoreductase ResA [Fictibacillus sp. 26RED30]MBH0163732.1 thiol-disulfide oxidoreductase ResA [Fictibacillus sp. 7GRE50]MBH0169642.1 thiol-disulfide oxidoreductase ResA [Fictibacillus sp. 18YEL24]MBH0174142.1 thiol-disulfide oxidoreductase ResA [Fictibacillus sp. 23RED33]
MKKNRFIYRSLILGVFVLVIGYTLYINLFKEKNSLVQVGDQAPNFVLKDLNGKSVKLSDYRGKGVFLNFWGTWCKPCEREMPYMERQYQKYKDQGVEILAVNIAESNVSVKNFVDRYHLSFPIPMDKDREVTKAFGIGPIPTTVLIDKNGKIVKKTTASLSEKDIISFMNQIVPKEKK